ncbi:CPBP family glutamic-type intramembrane protease [Massilia sp. DJPM01]|uniref:CPBP family glutamic-type intramembrane protease n=1 Tax=Massilia sp. DJPM01 TaxID=3024404 RepID=UPI00259DB6E0|nr:CPBP family glutamic-type intramembrane protease [Massilia sp. DJPM01]MDM5181099.1 CPBP family glutamic-type intramembrane protease [Massilia sp. DJPM01]
MQKIDYPFKLDGVIVKRNPPILNLAMLIVASVLLSSTLGGVTAVLLAEIMSPEKFGENAGRAIFATNSLVKIFLSAIIFTPPIETFLVQTIPIEVIRRITVRTAPPILFSTALFSIGHYLNGGLMHGLITLVTGAILSTLYLTLRKHGALISSLSVIVAHSLHNLIILIFVYTF